MNAKLMFLFSILGDSTICPTVLTHQSPTDVMETRIVEQIQIFPFVRTRYLIFNL
jgi:hypothetical protein